MTPEGFHKELAAAGEKMSLGTVYSTLNQFAAAGLVKAGVSNALVVNGEAVRVFQELIPDASLAAVHVYFPDPWWKKRHAKRRLNGPATFDPAARLLRAGGELFIQTDVEDRAAGLLEDLRQHGGFELPAEGFVQDNPFHARSNREKRAIEDGLPIYRILVRRR